MSEKHFSFVLIPGFSLVSFSCAIDALRGANLILDKQYYEWDSLGSPAGPILSSSEIAVPVLGLDEALQTDLIAICGGTHSHNYRNGDLDHWLHGRAKDGIRIGSISDGAFVAAAAGLFDHVPSTIHWRCQDAYRERFPDLDIKTSMLEINASRFSCAGGTSSLDLMLHFVDEDHGSELVSLIAQNFFHDTIRDGAREQHLINAFRIAGTNPAASQAVLLMEANLEQPLSVERIASEVGISRRQLDRVFQQDMNRSPKEFYCQLRLARASNLLVQTSLSIGEIAVGCGFQSASHLSAHSKKRFDATPGAYRRTRARNQDAGINGS